MGGEGSKRYAAEGDRHVVFELRRSRKFYRAFLTVVLVVLGWHVGRSVSHWLSTSMLADMAVSIICSGLGAALAASLTKRLSIFDPRNALILEVSGYGIKLGSPTSLTLTWDEIDRIKLVRTTYGSLPEHYLQVLRASTGDPSASSPEIIHHLGVIWDKRAQELSDLLKAFTPGSRVTQTPDDGSYVSEKWTGPL
jgi:hypothetical protein